MFCWTINHWVMFNEPNQRYFLSASTFTTLFTFYAGATVGIKNVYTHWIRWLISLISTTLAQGKVPNGQSNAFFFYLIVDFILVTSVDLCSGMIYIDVIIMCDRLFPLSPHKISLSFMTTIFFVLRCLITTKTSE